MFKTPEHSATDVLSDVLRAVHLTGAVYFDFELRAPWVAEAPPSRDIAGQVMPGAQRVIEYHWIAKGSCWGHAIGAEPVRLSEGDVIAFPQGDAHVLSSTPGMRSAPNLSMYARPTTPLPMVYEMGAGGPDCVRVVCCFLGCDERPYNPLLAALPPVIHLAASETPSSIGWLGTLLGAATGESRASRPGSENVLERLSELVFVELVRQHIAGLDPTHAGWLAGLRDPVVGRALGALHGQPASQWTVERLARHVGLSRSMFSERFTAMVGDSPMQYLARWRMQLAAHHLLAGESVAVAAEKVGYQSEAAFSRAFKKSVGEAPATWRRTTQARPNAAGAPARR